MKTYNIYLWPGSGYFCNQFIAKGKDEIDALENLTVELINNNEKSYFKTIEKFEEIFKDEIAQDENYQDVLTQQLMGPHIQFIY